MTSNKWLQSSALAFMLVASPPMHNDAHAQTARPTTQPVKQPKSSGFVGMKDQDARPITAQTFAGKNQVVFFGFDGCSTACAIQLPKMKAAVEELQQKGYGARLQNTVPVFVSVNPFSDPRGMKSYLSTVPHPAGMLGLNSNEGVMERAKKEFFVVAPTGDKFAGGNKSLDHSSAVYFVDSAGTISMLDSSTPQRLAATMAEKLPPAPTTNPSAGRD